MTFEEMEKEEGHDYSLLGYWSGDLTVESDSFGEITFNLKAFKYLDSYGFTFSSGYEECEDKAYEVEEIKSAKYIADGKEVVETDKEKLKELYEDCIDNIGLGLSDKDFKS